MLLSCGPYKKDRTASVKMNIVYIFRVFNCRNYPLLSPLIRNATKSEASLLPRKNALFSTANLTTDTLHNLKKDVLLYSCEKSKIFKYLSIFSFVQLGVCIGCGSDVFLNLRDTSKSEINNEEIRTKSTLFRRINLGDKKYRFVFTILCLGFGGATLLISCSLPSRILKKLILCKGGRIVSIITHGPFGRNITFNVPLQKINCLLAREEAKTYIPLKIKNKKFYYLVDSSGQFHQPKLFDYTVGTRTAKPY